MSMLCRDVWPITCVAWLSLFSLLIAHFALSGLLYHQEQLQVLEGEHDAEGSSTGSVDDIDSEGSSAGTVPAKSAVGSQDVVPKTKEQLLKLMEETSAQMR